MLNKASIFNKGEQNIIGRFEGLLFYDEQHVSIIPGVDAFPLYFSIRLLYPVITCFVRTKFKLVNIFDYLLCIE